MREDSDKIEFRWSRTQVCKGGDGTGGAFLGKKSLLLTRYDDKVLLKLTITLAVPCALPIPAMIAYVLWLILCASCSPP